MRTIYLVQLPNALVCFYTCSQHLPSHHAQLERELPPHDLKKKRKRMKKINFQWRCVTNLPSREAMWSAVLFTVSTALTSAPSAISLWTADRFPKWAKGTKRNEYHYNRKNNNDKNQFKNSGSSPFLEYSINKFPLLMDAVMEPTC